MKKLIFLATIFLVSMACTKDSAETVAVDGAAELLFQSGFETDTVIARGTDADLVGADKNFKEKNNWVADLDNHPEIGNFNIQFHQGGDSTTRWASVIQEPAKPSNHVLKFWLNEPSPSQSNGRIQGNMYGNKGMKEFSQSERIYLHPDFNTVKEFPKTIHWLTIAEFWNNITWSQTVPNRFRITLGIGKTSAGAGDLFFILDAEDCELYADNSQKYTKVWAETNTTVKVPIGQWFTMEYYYKEGDKNNGRFFMAIIPEGGARQVIFDVKNITHNTTDAALDGVSDFNPIKLYTSKELVQFMNSKGKTLQIYWDDFRFWKGMGVAVP